MTEATAKTEGFRARLRETGVVAVIRAVSADAAVAISHALAKGGVLGIEITFSTPGAPEAIARVRREIPKALIGAGTVLERSELDQAHEAGAEFLVSPHFDEDLVRAAAERAVPYMPGALTATEVVRAWKAGATCVKLFPGSAVGPGYLKALRGPLPQIPLMPTGGVDEKNLGEWLAAGAIAVGMGGALATGSLESIEAAAQRIKSALMSARGTA